MTDFALPADLAYNRGLIEDPGAYAKAGGFRSWLYLVGDEFASLPGGMCYAQVQQAVPASASRRHSAPRRKYENGCAGPWRRCELTFSLTPQH